MSVGPSARPHDIVVLGGQVGFRERFNQTWRTLAVTSPNLGHVGDMVN